MNQLVVNQKTFYSDYPSSSSTLWASDSDTTQEDDSQEDTEGQGIGGTTREDNAQEVIKFEKRDINEAIKMRTMHSELTRILGEHLTADEMAELASLKGFSGTSKKNNTDTGNEGAHDSKTPNLMLKKNSVIKYLWVACL